MELSQFNAMNQTIGNVGQPKADAFSSFNIKPQTNAVQQQVSLEKQSQKDEFVKNGDTKKKVLIGLGIVAAIAGCAVLIYNLVKRGKLSSETSAISDAIKNETTRKAERAAENSELLEQITTLQDKAYNADCRRKAVEARVRKIHESVYDREGMTYDVKKLISRAEGEKSANTLTGMAADFNGFKNAKIVYQGGKIYENPMCKEAFLQNCEILPSSIERDVEYNREVLEKIKDIIKSINADTKEVLNRPSYKRAHAIYKGINKIDIAPVTEFLSEGVFSEKDLPAGFEAKARGIINELKKVYENNGGFNFS